MKTKAEIISEILKHTSDLPSAQVPPYDEEPDDEEAIVAKLQALLPDTDLLTCEDMSQLNVTCCEICHTFYPEDELSLVDGPGGKKAWVCCSIRSALNPERNGEPNAVMETWLRWGEID